MAYLRLILGGVVYAVAFVLLVPTVLFIHVCEALGDLAENLMGDS